MKRRRWRMPIILPSGFSMWSINWLLREKKRIASADGWFVLRKMWKNFRLSALYSVVNFIKNCRCRSDWFSPLGEVPMPNRGQRGGWWKTILCMPMSWKSLPRRTWSVRKTNAKYRPRCGTVWLPRSKDIPLREISGIRESPIQSVMKNIRRCSLIW